MINIFVPTVLKPFSKTCAKPTKDATVGKTNKIIHFKQIINIKQFKKLSILLIKKFAFLQIVHFCDNSLKLSYKIDFRCRLFQMFNNRKKN